MKSKSVGAIALVICGRNVSGFVYLDGQVDRPLFQCQGNGAGARRNVMRLCRMWTQVCRPGLVFDEVEEKIDC